jgi:hypothetical protein
LPTENIVGNFYWDLRSLHGPDDTTCELKLTFGGEVIKIVPLEPKDVSAGSERDNRYESLGDVTLGPDKLFEVSFSCDFGTSGQQDEEKSAVLWFDDMWIGIN